MRQYLAAFVIFASLAPFSQAKAQQFIQSQEGIALQNEILQLQSQVQSLQAGGGGGSGGGNNGGSSLGGGAPEPQGNGAPIGGGVVASLLTQVQQLQAQVQDLSGKVDTLQNEVNQQHDQTEKEIGDLNFKLTGGAASGAAAGAGQLALPGTATPPREGPGPDTAAAPPAQAVPATLHDAQAAYAGHNYTGAEAAGRAVVAKGGPGAYAAQYVVAESLAAENKPQDAAIAYDDAYNKNHNGTYAAPSLLGLATALANIHQDQAACSTLSSLNSQFPTPPAGMAPRIEALSHRAHCG